MAAGDISKTMLSRVRARLGDKAGNTWSSSTLYAFLNDGFRALAQEVPDGALFHLTRIDSQALVGAQSNYDLPTSYLRPRIVKYKTLYAKRWPIRDLQALRTNTAYTPSETEPYWYIWDNDLHFVVGTVTQGNGEKYELWYLKQPVTISASVDPELPRQYFLPVETYAVSRALESISGPDETGQGAAAEAKRQMALFHELCFVMALRFRTDVPYDGTPNDPDLRALREAVTA